MQAVGGARQAPTFRRRRGRGDRSGPGPHRRRRWTDRGRGSCHGDRLEGAARCGAGTSAPRGLRRRPAPGGPLRCCPRRLRDSGLLISTALGPCPRSRAQGAPFPGVERRPHRTDTFHGHVSPCVDRVRVWERVRPERGSAGTGPASSTPEEVFRQEDGSSSPPVTFPAVPDGNCVIVRWGGEQPEGNDQSVG